LVSWGTCLGNWRFVFLGCLGTLYGQIDFDRWEQHTSTHIKNTPKIPGEGRDFFEVKEGTWQLLTFTPSPSGLIKIDGNKRVFFLAALSGTSIFHTQPKRVFVFFLSFLLFPLTLSWITLGAQWDKGR